MTAAFGHPGTYFTESLLLDNVVVNDTSSVAAFVASVDRGPTVPTKVSDTAGVRRALGDFTGITNEDILLQACYDAFANGARTLWINRVPGSGAVSSSVTLLTKVVAPATTGVAALTLTAPNPGVWGNQIYVEIDPGSLSTTFNITTRIVPTGAAITNGQIVDRITDVSLNPRDPRYVLNVINNLTSPDAYLVATIPSTYTYTAGDVIATSSVLPGGDKMTGGADGTRDGGTLDAAARQAAVYALDVITSPFLLNVPGVNDATTVNMLTAYADSAFTRVDGTPGRGDVFVIVDGDGGPAATATTPTAVANKVQTYIRSDAAAAYYPWLLVPDPLNGSQGATKLVPPGPSVVGRFIATDSLKGPFKSAAGTSDGRINSVISTDPTINSGSGLRSSDLDTLQTANVNVIKSIPGYGRAVIFGARTLKSDSITRYVSARRTIIYARAALRQATAFAPFENNDSTLWAALYSEADKICRQLMSAGGLRGATAQQAYYVVCGPTNNTPATIARGEVHLSVGLAIQRPAEFVVIQIGQFQSGTAITESASVSTGF